MIDFDNINDWAPRLTAELRQHVPDSVRQKLLKAELEDIDAQDTLFKLTNREAIIDAVVAWLRSIDIACYHGSRLIDAETDSVQKIGLIPLKAEARRDRLIRILSPHPKWPDVKDQLDVAIRNVQGSYPASREGQVHFTFSKTDLTRHCYHHLNYGSEFDQWVARSLLGSDGMELLAHYGEPRIFQVAVPGNEALDAANWLSPINDCRKRGEIPNLVDKFLKCWCYWLVDPTFQSWTFGVNCGIVFRKTIPADWIKGFETLSGVCKSDYTVDSNL